MSLEQDVKMLSQAPIFSQLDGEALRLLAFTAEKQSFAKGEFLYRNGEPADCAYLLVSGNLRFEAGDIAGSNNLVAGAYTLVGETALITATQRSTDAVATEDCNTFKIPRSLFLRIMREFPGGAVKVRAFLARQLLGFTQEIDAARQRADLRAVQ